MATKAKALKRSSRSRGHVHASKRTGSIKDSDRELLGIPKSEWAAAKWKERIVKRALKYNVESAAEAADCSERTIRRLVASYRIEPSLLAFLPRRPGPKPGSQRLELEQESIIAKALERWKASAEPLPVERAVEDVRRLAKAAGLKPVARNTIVLRLWERGGNATRQRSPNERIQSDVPRTRRALGIGVDARFQEKVAL